MMRSYVSTSTADVSLPGPKSRLLFLQPHARSAAVLGDELDAGRFEGRADIRVRELEDA
jgi:hypothetical protein